MAKRVLIVDDEMPIREICQEFMTSVGLEADVAEDGLQGLEKIAASKPDLVILDMMMPKCNGAEMLAKLQTQGTKVPVIVMTAYQNAAQEKTIRQNPNVVDFLQKPVDWVALVTRVQELVTAPPKP